MLRKHRISRGRRQCYYCKCSFDWDNPLSEFYPTRDHKLPRSKGGKNAGNIVLACRRCNGEKGSMTIAEYKEFLEVTKGCHGRVAKMIRWKKHLGLWDHENGKALVAQRTEHQPSKLGVDGSNPSERAMRTSA